MVIIFLTAVKPKKET